MKIEIALYAGLSRYLPPGAQNRKAVIEIRGGATVRDVMNGLGIPQEMPGIVLVNGKQAAEGTVVQDGETVAVFPPLAGGGPDWTPR